MDTVWILYNLAMLSLCAAGLIIVISSAVVATRRGMKFAELIQAIFGIVLMASTILYWSIGSPSLFNELPQWYFMLGAFMLGYGGFGITLWALDPELAEKMAP